MRWKFEVSGRLTPEMWEEMKAYWEQNKHVCLYESWTVHYNTDQFVYIAEVSYYHDCHEEGMSLAYLFEEGINITQTDCWARDWYEFRT